MKCYMKDKQLCFMIYVCYFPQKTFRNFILVCTCTAHYGHFLQLLYYYSFHFVSGQILSFFILYVCTASLSCFYVITSQYLILYISSSIYFQFTQFVVYCFLFNCYFCLFYAAMADSLTDHVYKLKYNRNSRWWQQQQYQQWQYYQQQQYQWWQY